jgi:hypothetical protein
VLCRKRWAHSSAPFKPSIDFHRAGPTLRAFGIWRATTFSASASFSERARLLVGDRGQVGVLAPRQLLDAAAECRYRRRSFAASCNCHLPPQAHSQATVVALGDPIQAPASVAGAANLTPASPQQLGVYATPPQTSATHTMVCGSPMSEVEIRCRAE